MLQYGWYVDNSKDFSGMTIWKMSIYVHLCGNMGDILIIQTKISGVKNWKMSIYVHLCCSMGDMLIIQMGRKHMSTKWGHILSGVAFEFNCIIEKTHILSGRGGLYIYIYIYLPMFQAYAVAEQLVLKCLPMLLLPVPSASEGTSHKTQNDPNIFNFQNGVKTTKQLSQAKIRFPWEILSNRSCGRSRARACFKLRIHQGHTHTKKNPPTPANSRGSASEEKCRLPRHNNERCFSKSHFSRRFKKYQKITCRNGILQRDARWSCQFHGVLPWRAGGLDAGVRGSRARFPEASENNVCPALAS